MPAILALGSNVGDKKENLNRALEEIKMFFSVEEVSRVFSSPPVDFTAQDTFLNQVIQIATPSEEPVMFLKMLNNIENKMGRIKKINKGPRLIDIDIIFIDFILFQSKTLTIPHPSAIERSFVIIPLRELSFFKELEKKFSFETHFSNFCQPLIE